MRVLWLKKHHSERADMDMNDDKAGLILNAIGLAVVELIEEQVPITRDSLADTIERNWLGCNAETIGYQRYSRFNK